jgi:hypothetical protein
LKGFPVTEPKFLHLRAESLEDVPPLSAVLQDMALMAGDIGYDPKARRVLILGNRFRWEAPEAPERMRSMVRIEFVNRAQRRDWPALGEEVFSLLAMEAEERADGAAVLHLSFSGGPSLRVEAEVIDVTLVDLAGPWQASRMPEHLV